MTLVIGVDYYEQHPTGRKTTQALPPLPQQPLVPQHRGHRCPSPAFAPGLQRSLRPGKWRPTLGPLDTFWKGRQPSSPPNGPVLFPSSCPGTPWPQCPGKGTGPGPWRPPGALEAAAAGLSFPELGRPAGCSRSSARSSHSHRTMVPAGPGGLLCPREAGSRQLARKAWGFAGKTERQLYALSSAPIC